MALLGLCMDLTEPGETCPICLKWQTAKVRDGVRYCDRCTNVLTQHSGGNGYMSPKPHHWHLSTMAVPGANPVPAKQAIGEELCADCYREAWAEAYPGQRCPVTGPHEAKHDLDMSANFGPEHNYAKAQYQHKANGHLIVDGKEVADTLQCVHCGSHWIPVEGSGIIRGKCYRCRGPICGPQCIECVPQEQWMENVEHGRAPNFTPIIVAPGYGQSAQPAPPVAKPTDKKRKLTDILQQLLAAMEE